MPQGGFTPPEDFKYPGPHGTRSVSWGDWRMPSDAVAALWMEELESLHGEFLSGCPERNQRGTRGQAQMSAPRSYSPVPIPSGLRPSPLDKESRPLDPRFTGAPTRRADLLLQRRGWLSRLTLPRLSLPLTGRERKLGTPLFESAFVAVGLKLCGLEMPGGPVCRPYGICRSAPSFRRGRTLAGPPY